MERAIGAQSSPASFAQLLTAMDRAGQIQREVRGKRTYRISLGPNADALTPFVAPASGAPPLSVSAGGSLEAAHDDQPGIDYDELALSMLRRVARTLASPTEASYGHITTARAERRIVSLERRLNEAERALARSSAENDQLRQHNADLEARLEASSQNIDNLMGQLDQRRSSPSARQRLDAGDIAVLDRLTRSSVDRPDSQTG